MNSPAKSLDMELRFAIPHSVSFTNLTILKWIAVVAMVADHLRYLPGMDSAVLFYFGRLAFPLFAFVLASHVARGYLSSDNSMLERMIQRLFFVGVAAQPLSMMLFKVDLWHLNIMFTFALCVALYRLPFTIAVAMALGLGAFVDYYWPGIIFFLAAVSFHRASVTQTQLPMAILGLVGSFVLLSLTVSIFASLAALPLIYWSVTGKTNFFLPRTGWFFYAFYPLHLYVLLLLRPYLN